MLLIVAISHQLIVLLVLCSEAMHAPSYKINQVLYILLYVLLTDDAPSDLKVSINV